jgi:hypothetical protein
MNCVDYTVFIRVLKVYCSVLITIFTILPVLYSYLLNYKISVHINGLVCRTTAHFGADASNVFRNLVSKSVTNVRFFYIKGANQNYSRYMIKAISVVII